MADFITYALHGFLGKPSDWDPLFPDGVVAIDLFNDEPIQSLWQWSEDFCKKAAKVNRRRVLMGYSLGGRLALHALTLQPKLWDAVIIISAHPGLSGEDEKLECSTRDEQWASRFENETWATLIKDWNRRETFMDSFCFERHETDYQRVRLAQALRMWSLSLQDNLIPRLAQIDVPVLWLAGSADKKYAGITQKVILKHPLSKKTIISGAGHRLPWQQPKEFLNEVTQFLKYQR